MQGPSAAANIPQPDTLSSPPLALREALRRAGSAPNVRREIQRVQSLIGLRWCVFFMRSPGGYCLKDGVLPARCGLSSPFQTRSIRVVGQLVPATRPFSIAGRIGILPGLISLAPVVRSHVPLPFLQIRRAPACAAGSPKPSSPGAAPGLRAIFSSFIGPLDLPRSLPLVSPCGLHIRAGSPARPREQVVSENQRDSASYIGNSLMFGAGSATVAKRRESAGLHPAVRGA